jgi:hypothetical protein
LIKPPPGSEDAQQQQQQQQESADDADGEGSQRYAGSQNSQDFNLARFNFLFFSLFLFFISQRKFLLLVDVLHYTTLNLNTKPNWN